MNSDQPDAQTLNLHCPSPIEADCIQLGHGGGGQLSSQLFNEVIAPRFANAELNRGHDSALLNLAGADVAFTTDSYVVNPLIFPGGSIGKLAVFGTVNDLLMAGARPQYISCSLIIEEGLAISTLGMILDDMADAAREAGVEIVTGDTKVVERGHGDGLFINTAGIGVREWPGVIAPQSIQPGDCLILSADIGRHGLAILAQRQGLQFDAPLQSDCASLLPAVTALFDAGLEVHCLRDATRGGLASVLVELAETSGCRFDVRESAIPVSPVVTGACELLGFDPLHIANEGCFVAAVAPEHAEQALVLLRQQAVSGSCALIGRVSEAGDGKVYLETPLGSRRVLRRMTGRLLPRIC